MPIVVAIFLKHKGYHSIICKTDPKKTFKFSFILYFGHHFRR